MGQRQPTAAPAAEPTWIGLLAVCVALVLYLRTLAPTVYGVDSAELTTGSYLLGIVHPPGAPTYLLLGHLFTWLPLGDVGYRVNLLSAVATAASLFLFYRIALRLRCAATLAAAVTLFVGVGYFVWASAVAAEIYAVQGCVCLGLVWIGLHWREEDGVGPAVGFGLLLGLGLGVHLSVALLVPGLALLILTGPAFGTVRRGSLAWCAAATLLGTAVYLYLPLRYAAGLPLNPARDSWQVDLTTLGGLWWMISARGFSHLFFATPAGGLPGTIAGFAFQMWSNYVGLGALLGVLGLSAGLRRDRSTHLALLAMVLAYVAFYLPYGASDRYVMFVPIFLLFGLWIAIGTEWLFERLALRLGGLPPSALATLTVFGLAATAVAINFPLLDISRDTSARDRGVQLIDTLAPDAVFFGTFPDLRMVEYLQYVEGLRGDIVPVDLHFARRDRQRERIAAALERAAPVYVSSCDSWRDPPWRCEQLEDCDCGRLSRLAGAP